MKLYNVYNKLLNLMLCVFFPFCHFSCRREFLFIFILFIVMYEYAICYVRKNILRYKILESMHDRQPVEDYEDREVTMFTHRNIIIEYTYMYVVWWYQPSCHASASYTNECRLHICISKKLYKKIGLGITAIQTPGFNWFAALWTTANYWRLHNSNIIVHWHIKALSYPPYIIHYDIVGIDFYFFVFVVLFPFALILSERRLC